LDYKEELTLKLEHYALMIKIYILFQKILIINQERQGLSGLNLFQTLKFIIVNSY
jgi:hypothetical protein